MHRVFARGAAQREQTLLRLFQLSWVRIGFGLQTAQQGFALGQCLLRTLQGRKGGVGRVLDILVG